jgi:hypothetical protein
LQAEVLSGEFNMTIVNAVEVVTSTKPNNGSTLIHLVLDETGSMGHVRQSTINSVNEYLNSQRGIAGGCTVTLTTFDVGHNRPIVRDIFRNRPIEEVQNLTLETYAPYGSTNLYDAIGHALVSTEAELSSQPTVPNVLIVIITDGEENASQEYNGPEGLARIKNMIKAKEALGWTVVYLGANQDAWAVGQTFGLAKGQTMSYNTAEMSSTMESLGNQTALYRSTRVMGGSAQASVAKDFFANPSTTVESVNPTTNIASQAFIPTFGAISTRPGGLDDDTNLHIQTLAKKTLSEKKED